MARRILARMGLIMASVMGGRVAHGQTEPVPVAPSPPTAAAAQASPPSAASAPDQAELADEFRAALAADSSSAPRPAAPPAASSGARLALLDLSFDLLGASGWSTAPEPELRALEAGGHDPKNRGFTLQNAELTFAGVVDPYLRGDANVVLQIDPGGQSTIELEEAYLTTLDLPFHLQIKAGQFFGAFGRINPTHPHTWDFVDQPVINARLLGGDGFRNPGAQVSWLAPLPFFLELSASVHNAQGETAPSFRGVPGASVAGRTLIDRGVHDPGDLAYLLRLRTSFDAGAELTLVPGVSALLGPNASGVDTRTEIYGADLYVKWKPLRNDHGWPFVAWQSEAIWRRYHAAAVIVEAAMVSARRTLNDAGVYSQLVWGFARPWTLALRFDYARSQNMKWAAGDTGYSTDRDPLRDRRARISGALTYYPSEFSKLRVQYNYDRGQFWAAHHAHSVYVQCEILFGAHGAHKF